MDPQQIIADLLEEVTSACKIAQEQFATLALAPAPAPIRSSSPVWPPDFVVPTDSWTRLALMLYVAQQGVLTRANIGDVAYQLGGYRNVPALEAKGWLYWPTGSHSTTRGKLTPLGNEEYLRRYPSLTFTQVQAACAMAWIVQPFAYADEK